MIRIEKGHAQSLSRYREEMEQRFGADFAADFAENNARRLLGLDAAGAGNRKRLKAFYDVHSIPDPGWWRD